MGSAAVLLIDRIALRLHGEHRNVELSLDHGALFAPDDVLGYRLLPGDYRIGEKVDNLEHVFHIRVNEDGHRATSYEAVHSRPRILFTGDSSVFGLGVNDEQTAPWLLQTRLPGYEVVNLSATSYSTVQALLQLRQIVPAVDKNDIVLLIYHPLTNDFNVAASGLMESLKIGFEVQLGDSQRMRRMEIPYGAIDGGGQLSIRHMSLACQFGERAPTCARANPGVDRAMQVTERAFDAIMALHPGHVAVVFVYGPDSDPVIDYVKSRGLPILDVRTNSSDPESNDVIPTDSHYGPYWHHALYLRLLDALRREHIIEGQ